VNACTVLACKTDAERLCDPSFDESRRNSQRFLAEGLKMNLVPTICLFIRGEWCVVYPYLQTKRKTLRRVLLVVLYFPNLGKEKELK